MWGLPRSHPIFFIFTALNLKFSDFFFFNMLWALWKNIQPKVLIEKKKISMKRIILKAGALNLILFLSTAE